MSTALSVRIETLPAIAMPPRLSGSLAHCVSLLTDPDNPYAHHVTVSERDAEEARQRLGQMEHLCRGASVAMIAAWCRKLVPHLAKAPANPQEFDRSIEGIAIACHDLPYAVWTAETVAETLKTQSWWPAPAKVREILMPAASALWRLRNGLKRAVDAAERAQPTPAPEVVTDEAKDHVAALVQSFTAERSFNAPLGSPNKLTIQAKPLSDGQQLAEYERIADEGGPFAQAAATRAETIRRKIGRPAGERV